MKHRTSKKMHIALVAGILAALFLHSPPRTMANPHDPFWAKDKALHFGASGCLAAAGYAASVPFTTKASWRITTAASLAITAGILKEVYDGSKHGDPSFRDFTWDLIGTATGTLVAWLVDRYLF